MHYNCVPCEYLAGRLSELLGECGGRCREMVCPKINNTIQIQNIEVNNVENIRWRDTYNIIIFEEYYCLVIN